MLPQQEGEAFGMEYSLPKIKKTWLKRKIIVFKTATGTCLGPTCAAIVKPCPWQKQISVGLHIFISVLVSQHYHRQQALTSQTPSWIKMATSDSKWLKSSTVQKWFSLAGYGIEAFWSILDQNGANFKRYSLIKMATPDRLWHHWTHLDVGHAVLQNDLSKLVHSSSESLSP